ncbi:MAG: zinc ribbon domain-containing protein [Oscillospiraceae bacterium]|nr:zinc ribbon domain-containing protein [Oscillospiraceae bacterium]
MAFCVRCGKRIPEGIVFCPYCGVNLREIMTDFEEKTASSAQEVPQWEQSAWEKPTQQAPAQEQPFTRQEPPFGGGQGYRQPYYTQKEDLRYLHMKRQTVPARGMGISGRIFSIIGFIGSILMLASFVISVGIHLEAGVQSFLTFYSEWAFRLFAGVGEALLFSLLGLILSSRAARRGNSNTAAGKRLGAVGLVLSAICLVDLILCLIVLLMG